MKSHIKSSELEAVALLSVETPSSSQEVSADLNMERSHLIWSLKRIGVKRLITPPEQLATLEVARRSLAPPPPDPAYAPNTLLRILRESERSRAQRDPIGEIGWPQSISIVPPPARPIRLGDQIAQPIQLCFYDELLGTPRALLVHYGETQAELSGYHANISSISVPIGGAISAIVVLRLTGELSARIARHAMLQEGDHGRHDRHDHLRGESSLSQDEITCIIHIDTRGLLIDGPWWPSLLNLTD